VYTHTHIQAPGKPFSEMAPVLEEEFGKAPTEIFKWIEETPLAAASLAQVCAHCNTL